MMKKRSSLKPRIETEELLKALSNSETKAGGIENVELERSETPNVTSQKSLEVEFFQIDENESKILTSLEDSLKQGRTSIQTSAKHPRTLRFCGEEHTKKKALKRSLNNESKQTKNRGDSKKSELVGNAQESLSSDCNVKSCFKSDSMHDSQNVSSKKRVDRKTSKIDTQTESKTQSKRVVKKRTRTTSISGFDRSKNYSSNALLQEELLSIISKIKKYPLSNAEKKRRKDNHDSKRSYCVQETGIIGKLPFWQAGWIIVQGARKHNLKSIDVPFPLSAFTVVTGVSGSGKSSLVENVLYRYAQRSLSRSKIPFGSCDNICGLERIDKICKVDQAPIGQSPTSNAATFTGAFDLIRQLYAQQPESKLRGYTPRRFSFNVPGGRCEKCEGSGIVKVEMHFLADVFITCDSCNGKRYDSDTLQIKYRGKTISDVLETTCGEALSFFEDIPAIAQILRVLCDVGLDYLSLGQPATTLSGGEAQRIKLAAELCRMDSGRTLYILDEPTTGLHFEDIRKLLDVIHRLVDLRNTVVVVEHNLDIIKNADWIVEIGPEAGLEGGRLVFTGTPEQLLEYSVNWQTNRDFQKNSLRSYTGEALLPIFQNSTFEERTVLDPIAYRESLRTKSNEFEEDLNTSNDLNVNSSSTKQPWDIDGKRWHTELRTTATGIPCKWDGRIISSIVEHLEEYSFLAEANWNNRTIVEVCSEHSPSLWFMQASTTEEWLLRLRFRTAKDSFETVSLTQLLSLKPLKDIDEIPLYGTLSRIKIENKGKWQVIELKAFSLTEINSSEFWNFLKKAANNFSKTIDVSNSTDISLMPWKTLGRDWHLSSAGLYGDKELSNTWTQDMLRTVFDLIEGLADDVVAVWTKKIAVPFSIQNIQSPWVQVYTKNNNFLCVQINFPQGKVINERLGFEPLIESIDSNIDSLYLRFRNSQEFDSAKLLKCLKDSYQKFKNRQR